MKNTRHLSTHSEEKTLRRNHIMNSCPKDVIEGIILKSSTLFFEKGQSIYHEGIRPIGVFLIKQGKVKLYKTDDDGRELIIRIACSPDLIGFEGMPTDHCYLESATALGPVEVLFLPRSEFRDIIVKNRRMSSALFEEMRDQLEIMENKMLELAYKSVSKRMCDTLLSLYHTYKKGNDTAVTIPITRRDLSEMIGTTNETTVRLIKKWMREGLLGSNGRKIVIEDVEKLHKLSKMNI